MRSREGARLCEDVAQRAALIGEMIDFIEKRSPDSVEEYRARIAQRMDADTTNERQSHEKLLDQFAKGKADILLGTQMVAKGLDFAGVTLVGVLDADLSLYCGDYHAQERTFSLLTQVVGRAGRRDKPGRAVIQTYTPENPVILAAARQDYRAFYDYELESRRAIGAPPFCDLFVFTVSSPGQEEAQKSAAGLAELLNQAMAGPFADQRAPLLGPAPAAIARLNRRYRFTLSFRGHNGRRVREMISAVLTACDRAGLTRLSAVSADMAALGQPAYRAKQIFHWLSRGVASFDEMSDLPLALRQTLAERCLLGAPEILRRQEAKDGTIKYLFGLRDGNSIESVLMRYDYGDSICLSTQAGCRMGCAFCASYDPARSRNLTAGEILEQVLFAQRDSGRKVSHIVLMGTGEPLDNYDNVMTFLRLVTHPDGLGLGMRHISLSTCGIVPRIRELAELRLQLTLSVSLHAPSDELRDRIMKIITIRVPRALSRILAGRGRRH